MFSEYERDDSVNKNSPTNTVPVTVEKERSPPYEKFLFVANIGKEITNANTSHHNGSQDNEVKKPKNFNVMKTRISGENMRAGQHRPKKNQSQEKTYLGKFKPSE